MKRTHEYLKIEDLVKKAYYLGKSVRVIYGNNHKWYAVVNLRPLVFAYSRNYSVLERLKFSLERLCKKYGVRYEI